MPLTSHKTTAGATKAHHDGCPCALFGGNCLGTLGRIDLYDIDNSPATSSVVTSVITTSSSLFLPIEVIFPYQLKSYLLITEFTSQAAIEMVDDVRSVSHLAADYDLIAKFNEKEIDTWTQQPTVRAVEAACAELRSILIKYHVWMLAVRPGITPWWMMR